MKQLFSAEEDAEGVRIDRFLAEECDGLSRSFLQKLLRAGQVTVNGAAVKPSFPLTPGDRIELDVPEAVIPRIVPQKMELDILYEDDDILIVNKPKGMVVHPAPGHYEGTLVNGLMEHCGSCLSGINGVLRPGIVHRIDKDTTGLLAVCKNDMAHHSLAEQLRVHSITRRYLGIVHGVIREDRGTIDAPVGRHPTERKKMSVNFKNGRNAVTHYTVLERLDGYTLAWFSLETGRTHQIRVHMAYTGHPLLGDTVYGPAKNPFRLEGQTLHAGVLGLTHPRTGEYLEFTAPLPEYFEKLLMRLRGQTASPPLISR